MKSLILSLCVSSILAATIAAASPSSGTGTVEIEVNDRDVVCDDFRMYIKSYKLSGVTMFPHHSFSGDFLTANSCYRALFSLLDSKPAIVSIPYQVSITDQTGYRWWGNCDGAHGCREEKYTFQRETIEFSFGGTKLKSMESNEGERGG